MKIEEISKEQLLKVEVKELHQLRLRSMQVFGKCTDVETLLEKYDALEKEMRTRNLVISTRPIDKALFSYRMDLRKRKKEEKSVSIFSKKEDERIVGGIVYAPGKENIDSQGDYSTEEEIRKMAYSFAEVGKFTLKMNHKGSPIDATVLETWLSPQDIEIEGQSIIKGTWIMTVRINDEKIWNKITKGELTGFSMAGYSKVTEEESVERNKI